ncbi:MAG: DUF3072 domain-containing protein [Sphaerochaeta sp.]|jgi:hypothetical protein|nr:DUF3072 domain-containing protein [Sphaerochaeta sp.]
MTPENLLNPPTEAQCGYLKTLLIRNRLELPLAVWGSEDSNSKYQRAYQHATDNLTKTQVSELIDKLLDNDVSVDRLKSLGFDVICD